MSGGLRIGRILGIPIFLHPTWLIIFLLVAMMGSSQLGQLEPDWSSGQRSLAAAAVALLFSASILLHELGHSVLALRHRVAVRSITLFVFGGVAMMERDPDDARAEFEIAIAGPVVSALLALGFLAATRVVETESAAGFASSLLFRINLAVALFNLLPGFPLDGGRVLRAFLWARSGDLRQATHIAARSGEVMAYGLIAVGVVIGVQGDFISGVWLALIGWLLLMTAGATLRHAALEDSLAGLRARDLVAPIPARVASHTPVSVFVRDLAMRGRRWALLEDAGRVVGLVTLTDVQKLDPEAWESTPLGRVATPREQLLLAAADTPVRELLVTMGQRDVNQIPVLEHDEIIGAVTRESLVHALELRGRLAG